MTYFTIKNENPIITNTVIRSPESVVPVRRATVAFSLYFETISFITKIARMDASAPEVAIIMGSNMDLTMRGEA